MTYNTTFLRLFETILFCFVLFVSTVSRAQDTVIECDSALILPPDTNAVVSGCDADTMFSVAEYKDPTHRVRPAEWIVPSVAAVGGALCVKTAWGKQFRHWAQKNLSRHGEKKVWADNYMPYIPAAAVYALDLCGVKAQHCFLDRTIILGVQGVAPRW